MLLLASSLTLSQIDLLKLGHASPANSLFIPGAIFFPISAASIGIVPEPHKGSERILDGCHLLKSTNAAASVSFKGASPAISL